MRGSPTLRGRAAIASILAAMQLVVFAPRPVGADAISAKRKEAARLSAAIESLSARIDVLDEDSLDAGIRLAKARRLVARRSADVSGAERTLDRLQRSARLQALNDYAQPATLSVDDVTSAASLGDLERRAIYRSRSRETDRFAIDELAARSADLRVRRADAVRARTAVVALTATIAHKRREADALVVKYEALQRRATGDLARLVAAEQARVAAAEAKRARELLAARAAAAGRELARHYAAVARAAHRAGETSTSTGAIDVRARELAVQAGLTRELPASPGAARAVSLAMSQLGKPYVWGAAGPSSFDCSGLMLFAWGAAGRSLPHSSRSQFAATTRVPVSQVKPGDLVFYGSPIHHVGMYIGNGQMVEAPHRGRPVKTAPIFRRDLVGVGRVG